MGVTWRMAHDQSAEEVHQADERNRKEGVPSRRCRRLPGCDGEEGKPTSPLRRPVGAENPTR